MNCKNRIVGSPNVGYEKLVSVIVPVRNKAKLVEAAMGSIGTTCSCSLEFIVVNDASTDATTEVVERFSENGLAGQPVQLPTTGGVGKSRNRALPKAQGKYLLFFDGNDLMPDGALDQMVAAAETLESDVGVEKYEYHCNNFFKSERMSDIDKRIWKKVRSNDGAKQATEVDIFLLKQPANPLKRGMLNAAGHIR